MDKRIPEYTIITRNKVLENDIEDVLKEQNEKREILGLNGNEYICHFFGASPEYKLIPTIDIATEYLNMKDGADLVQFCNGNYGFVAYCNGKEDAFEIIG